MRIRKLKFDKQEQYTLGVLAALVGGMYYYGKQTIKNNLINTGYAYLNPDNSKLMPTDKATQIVKENKKIEVQQAENETLTTPASSLFDYNNPEYRASKNYYLSQSTGTFYDDEGNKINVENDGTISIGVWSAVKQGIKNVFSIF